MRLALATCNSMRELNTDDKLLCNELNKFGIQTNAIVWNEFNVNLENVLIRTPWDYYLHRSDFMSWLGILENAKSKVFNPCSLIRENLDKKYLLKFQPEEIVPTLIYSPTDIFEKAWEEILRKNWAEIIVKPTISASSYLTYRLNVANKSEIKSAWKKVAAHSAVMIQPFLLPILSEGELSLVFFRGNEIRFSHGVCKSPQAGDFRIQSEYGGQYKLVDPPAKALGLAKRVVAEISSDWLYARVDILDWKRNPVISELELIEPDLYLRMHPPSLELFAQTIAGKYFS